MDIGGRLKERREAQHLTQEQLSEIVGVHPNTIRRWEIAGRTPTAKIMPDIAKALNTTVAYLSGESDDPVRMEEGEDTLLSSVATPSISAQMKDDAFVLGGDLIGSGKVLLYEGNGQRVVLPATPENQEWIRNLVAGAIANKTS